MNRIINQYIQNTEKELEHLSDTADFLSDLRSNLEEYVHEFPESTYEDLVERFGSPEAVASEYKNSPASRTQEKHTKKKILYGVIIAAAAAAILFLSWWVHSISDHSVAKTEDSVIENSMKTPTPVTPGTIISSDTRTLSDGSSITDELEVFETEDTYSDDSEEGSATGGGSSVSTRIATRTFTACDASGETLWTYTLTGVFRFDGSSSAAVSATDEFSTNNDWEYTWCAAKYIENTVTGSAEFTYLDSSMSVECAIQCAADGTISNVDPE